MQTLKERIIAESKQLGIDKIGFTTADSFDYMEESLLEQRALGHTSGFEHQNIKERLYPEETFENPKSIIAIALAYPTKIHDKVLVMKNADNLPVLRGERIITSF